MVQDDDRGAKVCQPAELAHESPRFRGRLFTPGVELDQRIIDDQAFVATSEIDHEWTVRTRRRGIVPASPNNKVVSLRDPEVEQPLLDYVQWVFAIAVPNPALSRSSADNRETVGDATSNVVPNPGLARATLGTDQRDASLGDYLVHAPSQLHFQGPDAWDLTYIGDQGRDSFGFLVATFRRCRKGTPGVSRLAECSQSTPVVLLTAFVKAFVD
jgi:hypothetical protein